MRKHFSSYIEKVVQDNDDLVFVTGDLGYNALENLGIKMGERFINGGVAEQSMIGIAAGMASQGYRVICYSIAPFVVYRCLEQIRNDVCFHNLPVFVVGNGGGYGYGIMGSSHHAIEDIGVLSGLPNMTCYAPAFIEDVVTSLDHMFTRNGPSYFRLGLGKNMPDYLSLQEYGSGTLANPNAKLTIIAQSPVANNVVAAINAGTHKNDIDLYVINKMPFTTLPDDIKNSITNTGNVLVIEEHISIGGLGSAVSLLINEAAIPIKKFISLRAEGYPGGLYGSQGYHQQLSGIDQGNITKTINAHF
jgi:transketolase